MLYCGCGIRADDDFFTTSIGNIVTLSEAKGLRGKSIVSALEILRFAQGDMAGRMT